jgi:hypothetical protein
MLPMGEGDRVRTGRDDGLVRMLAREQSRVAGCAKPRDARCEQPGLHGPAVGISVERIRFGITEAPEAFAVFDSGKTGKVMFEWA